MKIGSEQDIFKNLSILLFENELFNFLLLKRRIECKQCQVKSGYPNLNDDNNRDPKRNNHYVPTSAI